ncbi:MAG: tRNA uridine-5-carboxymethylaminomethyl(34) synthesis GTPase MnmE [Candidatus Omnitrophica bacterium]|nr:tRNA uridine-5-carboxymethylaminomethyl(34) synthesis GTPase MnmE [Candidatus Omnitrophota bacterium]
MGLDDTIVAISTPVGEGGIGIVRLSGKDALKVADRIFLSKDRKRPSRFKTYTVHYGHIVNKEQEIIDEAILTVMRAPKTYTREDVVEVNCHSGIVPLRKTLEMVLKNGARLAEPGEFTKRAFLNGRIDVSQAESVLDIIRAKTDLSLKAAVNNLKGLFSKKIEGIRNELMDVFAHIEVSIDFSEEDDVDRLKTKDVFNKLKHVKREIEKLISTARKGKILRQGIRTVICGSPNVGKSSLMNALLKESRAIVTHIPGTTRDTIEEIINIKGIPVVLVDTAGIARSRHPVTREGVRRSHFSIKEADLILFVLDYGRKIEKRDLDIMRKINDKEVVIVINKRDLKKRIDANKVRRVFPKKPVIYVSAINQSGIDELENIIQAVIFEGKAPSADFISISNDRQLDILNRSLEDVNSALSSYKDKLPMDCMGTYVRSAIEGLGEIAGHTITEEALDRIFSEFCIGK